MLAQDLTLEKKEQNMYIDPNTGGMLFQALAGLLAVISGGLLFFSRQIREGIARLRRRRRKDDEDSTK
jgi:LPXTG-motif cell wall-anchored protein